MMPLNGEEVGAAAELAIGDDVSELPTPSLRATSGRSRVMEEGTKSPLSKACKEGWIVRQATSAEGNWPEGVVLIPERLMPRDGVRESF